MLEVRGISKRFGGVQANTDVSLALPDSAIRCVIGPNGAGKSTLVSMLSGHVRPDRGTIHLRGKDITTWPAHRVASAGMVRKFQRPSFYPELTVRENLEIAVLGSGLRRRALAARVREVAESVRLGDALDKPAAHLPHGRTQWLEIGLVVGRRAQIMLLDEPTAGMTPGETTMTADLVRELVATQGVAAIVVEHDMGFVRALDAEVTVLHLGRVIAEGSMSQIEQDAQVRAVYLGEEVA
ncbi:ATP-binding cassette domain-containing protein [Streptomyces fulvoviolaceus]|uniref:ATP-binding cassette domain-containing protein n=1 Tax=Streptomyces fulvoviolaceus TaxID=285535 RepID=UPI0005BE44ED|nr:ATP-binding cassette domain-containing protein [Streptomyces fulvoviolaceus]